MNVTATDLNENVLPLFASIEISRSPALSDPLQDLLDEAQAEAWEEKQEMLQTVKAERLLVTAHQFPDQSLFILEAQLAQLTKTLGRLKFYHSDLDDLLPR